MIEKLECTCIEAYKTRKMRDPNCCACSCDHNDLVEQLAKANERVKELGRQLNQSKKINALIDECYLIRKSPTVGDLSIFMCAPVVCCGEKSSLTLYQEWAVYIDEQLRKEQE